MSSDMVNRPVIIRQGILLPKAGEGTQAPPGNGATIVIFDSTANTNNVGSQIVGVPFSRIQLNINSSHDSGVNGVLFESSFDDGLHWKTQSALTYLTANGATSYDYLLKGDHVRVSYTNSANVLTAWEMVLVSLIGDRNPGA